MIWKDDLKLSEIASFSKLARVSTPPLGRIGLICKTNQPETNGGKTIILAI